MESREKAIKNIISDAAGLWRKGILRLQAIFIWFVGMIV
jgi:hypothetical protein